MTNDPDAEWARWFLSEGATRSIAPGFTITPKDAQKLSENFATLLLDDSGAVAPSSR